MCGTEDCDVHRGRIGNYFSHVNLWKEIQQKGHRWTAIMEDDSRFLPHFVQNYTSYWRQVQEAGIESDWEYLLLGVGAPTTRKGRAQISYVVACRSFHQSAPISE